MDILTIDLSEIGEITDERLFRLCVRNKELRIERNAAGALEIMSPTGGTTGWRNSALIGLLYLWNRTSGLGRTFDSSTGFRLSNGAMRSADAAFVMLDRWDALSEENQKTFPPLCPDFVIELMSESDRLVTAQDKLAEWMDNGCRLAWLIDPEQETAYIYRTSREIEMVDSFNAILSGEDLLPGFELLLVELK